MPKHTANTLFTQALYHSLQESPDFNSNIPAENHNFALKIAESVPDFQRMRWVSSDLRGGVAEKCDKNEEICEIVPSSQTKFSRKFRVVSSK